MLDQTLQRDRDRAVSLAGFTQELFQLVAELEADAVASNVVIDLDLVQRYLLFGMHRKEVASVVSVLVNANDNWSLRWTTGFVCRLRHDGINDHIASLSA